MQKELCTEIAQNIAERFQEYFQCFIAMEILSQHYFFNIVNYINHQLTDNFLSFMIGKLTDF